MTLPSRVHHVLILAGDGVEAPPLVRVALDLPRDSRVLVVVPGHDPRPGAAGSGVHDRARRRADDRLVRCLAALDDAGVHVSGWVGDIDPRRAITDALALFHADELLLAGPPPARDDDLGAWACAAFSLPVVHLTVETARAAGAAA